MTQYLLAVHHSEDDEAPSPDDTQKAYRQVDEFNKDLEASGAWVFAGGLHPPSSATVVRSQGGDVLTTDGPFAETKEQLGGFVLIEARDLNEAIRVAAQIPSARIGSVEIRPVKDVRQRGGVEYSSSTAR